MLWLLFFVAAVSLISMYGLGVEENLWDLGYKFGFFAIAAFILCVAVSGYGYGDISMTVSAGSLGVFVYWLLCGNQVTPDYVKPTLVGMALIFFILTVISWLQFIKDKDRIYDILITVVVFFFIFFTK